MHTACSTPTPPAQLAVHQHNKAYYHNSNWSHFKPEFAGNRDEDAEAHLLRTNNWMDTHVFPEDVKDCGMNHLDP